MKDFAVSSDAAVQAQLDRLAALSLPQGRIGLEVIREILARFGNPQVDLPPVFHVAGTNGKGSTCAFLRAMLEAQGLSVHVATKPHLVRYNERIRLGGSLISDALLASLLKEVLDACEDLAPSFFEVTTAATFLAFHREPADACVIEVGLGGRFDATNVLEHPAVCGIASLGVDHEQFLLNEDPTAPSPDQPLVRIAFEKAGIARAGAPLVTQYYAPDVAEQVRKSARLAGAALSMRGDQWTAEVSTTGIAYCDAVGTLALPLPTMPGAHQADNASLAAAMIRHQDAVTVSQAAMAEGIVQTNWPARLQRLGDGPLTRMVPGHEVILDGGHNPDAALAMAKYLAKDAPGPTRAIVGMLSAKDARTTLKTIAPQLQSLIAIPIEGSESHPPADLAAIAKAAGVRFTDTAPSLAAALEKMHAEPLDGGTVLICGSLYLAGKVLALNEELPD